MTARRSAPWKLGLALAVAVAVVLGLEWRLFESSVRDHLLGTFPRFHDQNGYLKSAYLGYERIEEHGIWNAIAQRLSQPKAQGSLFEIEGAVGSLLIEPNRVGTLAVIFAHFAMLEIVTLYVATAMTGALGFGIIASALLISSGFVFADPGGWFDFRIDGAANCTFGIYAALLVRSAFYRDHRWAVAAGAVGGYLIALRHNMTAHLVVLHGIFVVAAVIADRREHRPRLLAPASRTRGLAYSVAALTLVGAPFLALDLGAVLAYYFGQFSIRAPVRNALSGRSAFQHAFFYPYAIWVHHIGYLLHLWVAYVAALWAYRRRPSNGGAAIARSSGFSYWIDRYLVPLAMIGAPLAVLTIHKDRSPLVIGLVTGPIVFAATFALQDVLGRLAPTDDRRWSKAPAVTAIATAGLCVAVALHGLQHLRWRAHQQTIRAAGATAFDMQYRVARLLYDLGQRSPIYVTNTMAQSLEPGIATTALFEHDRLVIFPEAPARRQQIFPPEESEFWRIVATTDAVLWQRRGKAIQFPYTEFVTSIEDELLRRIERDFVEIGEWSYGDMAASAHVAPRIRFREGINLEVHRDRRRPPSFSVRLPRIMLARRPHLILEGSLPEGPLPAVATVIDGRPVAGRMESVGSSAWLVVPSAKVSGEDGYVSLRVDFLADPAPPAGAGNSSWLPVTGRFATTAAPTGA